MHRIFLVFCLFFFLLATGCSEEQFTSADPTADEDGDGLTAIADCDEENPFKGRCEIGEACSFNEQCPQGTCFEGICSCDPPGSECETCPEGYTGENCDECADWHFALPDCKSCLPEFTGPGCDICAEPNTTTKYCNVPFGEYVDIPTGTFVMGSPETEECHEAQESQHQVTITIAFEAKVTEVTQAEWEGLMKLNPSRFTNCPDCPVEQVNWWEALTYCNTLSEEEGYEPCYTLGECEGSAGDGTYVCSSVTVNSADGMPQSCEGYRLPTESEWEYMARAGTTEAIFTGNLSACSQEDSASNAAGWYLDNSDTKTHPVGGKLANPWGLYDTSGNVWEWCWDWYAATYPGKVTDPMGPETGEFRTNRGGSWLNYARRTRAAARYSNFGAPHLRGDFVGFRPVRSKP